MITIHSATATAFTSNGLGVLMPIACEITEELNGEYTLVMDHPLDELERWKLIEEGRVIVAPCPTGPQPFRIDKIESAIDGIFTAYASHIFYDLRGAFIEDKRPADSNGITALTAALAGTGYTAYSDITNTATAYWIRMNVVAAILGDGDNSFIKRWGGELERDGKTVKMLARRGQDSGVSIRYRKNLTGLTVTTDMTGLVTRIMPTGLAADGQTVLVLPEKYIDSPYISAYADPHTYHYHYGDIQVSDDMTEAQAYDALRAQAQAIFDSGADLPMVTAKVEFVDLSQTEDYKQYAALERVYLGDTVSVTHEGMSISISTRVVSYEWDALRGRYIKITLGQVAANAAKTMNKIRDLTQVISVIADRTSAQEVATELITSALGGYVVKRPGEELIMDTEDPQTATQVWRWNLNGLGYSGTGINGPYTIAITMDGKINADFVQTGTLSAAVVFAGELLAARGTIDYLITGIETAQHMQLGMDANGDPYMRAYNGGNTLKVEVTPKGVGHRAISGTSLNANTGEWSIGTRVGIGIFVG